MRRQIRRQRVGAWFIVAVAAIAAAAADLLVEALSDRGAFGLVAFTDGSHAVNWPVASLGAIFLARVLYLCVRRALRGGAPAAAGASIVRDMTVRAVRDRLPAIFAVQIAALWLMETVEQHVVFGHGFGATVWLGGPVAVSLAAHAAACVLTAFAARSVLRALEPRALRLIRALLQFLGTVGEDRRPRFAPRAEPLLVRSCLIVCRIGVRAPPAAVA